MIKCILYDLDNTLCFCADWHYEALNMALNDVVNFEISREEHLKKFNGLPTKVKLNLLLEQKKINEHQIKLISDKKQNYTIDIIKEKALIDYEKIEMHKYVRSLNYKTACVTNSIRETAKLILENTGQFEYVDLLISNEDIKHSKPNSEGYVKAMVMLGSKPEETLIVEDSEVGLISARATGSHIYSIKDSTELNVDNLKLRLELC